MRSFRPLLLACVLTGFAAVARAQVSPTPSAAAATVDENGYHKIGFDLLAGYTFTPPPYDPAVPPGATPASGAEQIPAAVKALDGQKAAVVGYMVPVKMDKGGLVAEFLLMRNTLACCFGGVPNMNEWVIVKMRKPVASLMDTPIAVYGQLKVGAVFDNGYLTGIYELEAERLASATVPK